MPKNDVPSKQDRFDSQSPNTFAAGEPNLEFFHEGAIPIAETSSIKNIFLLFQLMY